MCCYSGDAVHGHGDASNQRNVTQRVLQNINSSQPVPRSIVAAIYISKAFDTVPIAIVISKIVATNIHLNYMKWLANLLSGRQAHASYI